MQLYLQMTAVQKIASSLADIVHFTNLLTHLVILKTG